MKFIRVPAVKNISHEIKGKDYKDQAEPMEESKRSVYDIFS
jgi:hypothetical protein